MLSIKSKSTLTVYPVKDLHGHIVVPGDKSLSHRAVMLGAISEGLTSINGFLYGQDTLATVNVFQNLGVQIDVGHNSEQPVVIHGKGLLGLQAPQQALDFQNSGTGLRLAAGLLAGQPFKSVLKGDASLSTRPMSRIIEPLQKMGARIESAVSPKGESILPLTIYGTKLKTARLHTKVASAQVKSSLMLAALCVEGESQITEIKPTRDHTENLLSTFGAKLRRKDNTIILNGHQTLTGCDIDIPGDISSAAFFIVLGLLTKDSNLIIKNVGLNPLRTGLIEILRLMGANIEIVNESTRCSEKVGDIVVCPSQLTGIEIPEHLISDAIDEFPIIMIAAALASGTTILRNAPELRVKESDRIHAMAVGLKQLGIEVQELENGLKIEGGAFTGGEVDSFGDHRIAMAFAVAGMLSRDAVCIHDTDAISTSFPNFLDICHQLHIKIEKSII